MEKGFYPYLYFLAVCSLAIAVGVGVGACNGFHSYERTSPADGKARTESQETGAEQEPREKAMNDSLAAHSAENETEIATFAAGCFWCVEAVLEQIDGVLDVESGYMGGTTENPSYADVCTGQTGHAEVVRVQFDPRILSFDDLCSWFWRLHDPTTRDRQGADHGTQYRSAIFWHSEAQRKTAEASKAAHAAEFRDPIVTEITEASAYWKAEVDHQDYYRLNPNAGYCRAVIAPKLEKLLRKK